MPHPRTRLAAVAGSLALTLGLVSAPALAQDGPEATVEDFLAAMEAKDFEALPAFFCEEYSDQLGTLDIAAMSEDMPPGVDVNTLLDAFIIDAEVASTEVLSQSDTEAVVKLEGTLSMEVDAEAIVPFIEALLEASGMDVTDETVEMFTGLMLSELQAETTEISEEITLVPGEEMPWIICSELGSMADDEMTDDGMSDDSTGDDMGDDTGDDMGDDGSTEEPAEGE